MSKGKHGLGRGLEALLPGLDVQEGERVTDIPVDQVEPNPFQPRRVFDEEKLSELAESIREHGVLQPVIVRSVGERFQLVAGERRWRAARLAGLKTLPGVVREMSDAAMMEVALVENIQRQDLNPLEEARAYRTLIDKIGLTQETLAARLGKSRPAVANALRLLQLDREVQGWVESGRLSMGHARALLAIEDPAQQRLIGQRVAQQGLNVRQAEEAVRKAVSGGRPGPKRGRGALVGRSPELAAAEEGLRLALGARVHIRHGQRRGTLEIEYFGSADLERIYEIITGTQLSL